MAKPKIIDIDAEFEGIEFDEESINRATGVIKRRENGWYEANSERLKDPEYLTKLAEGKKNSKSFQEARKKLKGNEEFKKSIKKGLEEYNQKNPGHKQKQIDRTILQNKDPKWLEAVTIGNRNKRLDIEHVAKMDRMYKSKEWKESHLKGVQSIEGRKNHQRGVLLKTAKPIITNQGIFISQIEAVKYILDNNILPTRKTLQSVSNWLRSQIKSNPKEYYHISIEEYVVLTGKDPYEHFK